MADTTPIPVADLPTVVPGDYDYVVVAQNGNARKALAPEVTAAAASLAEALDDVVSEAQMAAAAQLAALGYQPPVAYASSLFMATANQTVDYGGNIYAPIASELPFTTSGTFENAKFRLIVPGMFIQSGTGAVPRTMQAKAREWITPYDFGAVGDGVADDTLAVQAFFDHLRDNRVMQSACAGKFLLTAKLLWGNASVEFATKNTHFDCEFITGYTSTEEAIRIAGYHDASPTGSIHLTCGASTYSDRRQYDGVIIDTTSRASLNLRLDVTGVKRWAVRNIGAGNNGRIDKITTKYCGSGRAAGIQIPPGSFTSNTKNGSSSATNQRSVLGGVTVPPELQVDDYLVIDGEGFRVTAVDAGAGTIEVFPWVVSTSGTILYAVGGGLSEEGPNANVWQYGSVTTSLGGCGLRWHNTNPGNISAFHTASNTIGIAAGRTSVAALVGGSISECYVEGGSHDIEVFEATFASVSAVLNTTGGFRIANCRKIQANTGSSYAKTTTLTMEFRIGGTPVRWLNTPRNGGSGARTYTLGTPKRQHNNNTQTITLADEPGIDDALGINTIEWASYGSGANGQPTGSVTVQGQSGATVNGAASVTYSGFSYPPEFRAYRVNGSPINWIVTPIQNQPVLQGSKTYDWPDLASGAQQTTTVTVTGAALGDYAETSMSVNLEGTALRAYVSAADTVTVVQRNDTGANVNLASGTLRVRVRKA